MSKTARNFFFAASCFAMAGCSPAADTSEGSTEVAETEVSDAQQMAPADVVQQHVDAMKTGEIDTIMSDYAEDTVVIAPQGLVSDQTPAEGPGVFSGIQEAQRVFAAIVQPGDNSAVEEMETRIETKGDDVVFLHWVQSSGTPNEVSGTDVFIVRDGKIAFQDIIVND